MNDWQVLDCEVTFLTRNWPKYCKQPNLSYNPHAAETSFYKRQNLPHFQVFCTFAIYLMASWLVIIFGNPNGRSPMWWGTRARVLLRCGGLGDGCAVWCSTLEGAFVGTQNNLDKLHTLFCSWSAVSSITWVYIAMFVSWQILLLERCGSFQTWSHSSVLTFIKFIFSENWVYSWEIW